LPKTKIKFGTSGWRGILADEFTFANVRIVVQAISNCIKNNKLSDRPVIVGYDTRFMGEEFARETIKVLAGNKIKGLLCNRDTPTPVIAHEIIKKKAAGGINFTASHNPHQYNGIKFSPEWGGPALPETTRQIEKEIKGIKESDIKLISFDKANDKGLVKLTDPRKSYFKTLKNKLDVNTLTNSNLCVAIDPLYGTATGYIDKFLDEIDVSYDIIHNYKDAFFGGESPEPSEKQLKSLIGLVKENDEIQLGIATDGDADRFGIVDFDGRFIEPNIIVALLLDYLIETRGYKGGVARSVATTHLIDAVAKKHNRKVYETPVGFKYIGKLIYDGKIVIGGEESAGLTIKGHIPEKDGILACLLVAEMSANKNKPISVLVNEMYKSVGKFLTKRVNLRLSDKMKEKFLKNIKAPPKRIAGKKVVDVNKTDGTKLILEDGSWLLMRVSGTEPVVRLYVESHSQSELKKLVKAGENFILNKR
jgi:phosphoglucomutase